MPTGTGTRDQIYYLPDLGIKVSLQFKARLQNNPTTEPRLCATFFALVPFFIYLLCYKDAQLL